MKRCIMALFALSTALTATAENPIITEVFTADPAPLVYKDKVYLYVGQDSGDGSRYHIPRWRVFSTSDMVTWKDEGSPLKPTDFEWSSGEAWAGHVVEKDGKFYWYTTSEHKSRGKAIGVAVSDSPTGPFKDARGSALVTAGMTTDNDNHGWEDIDPAVFTDDDGVSYLYWGNRFCYWAKLKDNMTELDGEIHQVPAEQLVRFTEAPWVHKRGDLYYLSYASGFPEKIAYSVSKSVTGPWKPVGLVAEGAQNSNTIHQGIIHFKGKDYFFYHSGMIQYDQGAGQGHNGGGSFLRSVCIDYLYYNDDGMMKRVIQTSEGVDAVE
ncbi:MAG: glycoside hydrolase family 43 protein [Pontiellaceae bacterium]|nr:glycoside hydrolase family 43 protein [Pontiellaceae bacterium]